MARPSLISVHPTGETQMLPTSWTVTSNQAGATVLSHPNGGRITLSRSHLSQVEIPLRTTLPDTITLTHWWCVCVEEPGPAGPLFQALALCQKAKIAIAYNQTKELKQITGSLEKLPLELAVTHYSELVDLADHLLSSKTHYPQMLADNKDAVARFNHWLQQVATAKITHALAKDRAH